MQVNSESCRENTQESSLTAYFSDLRRDINRSSDSNLVRGRKTIEALQKKLGRSQQTESKEIEEACAVFAEFLFEHITDRSLAFQLTNLQVLKNLKEKFNQLHQTEPDRYFSQFISHLIRHVRHENCRRICIEYLIALGLFEEIRQGENLSQGNCAILIHYYTQAFKVAKDSPDYLPILRELSSGVLLRILRYSFDQYATLTLGEDLTKPLPDLRGFKRYVTVLDQLKTQHIASHDHLQELYDLPRDLLTRSRIPAHLEGAVDTISDHIQKQLDALVLGTTPTNSFIEELQHALHAYRNKFQEDFDRLYANQIKKPDPIAIRGFQQAQYNAFRDLIERDLLRGPLFAFEPEDLPNYDLRAVGSVGREELSPYSDLECFILVEKQSPTLIRALNLLQLQMIAFGETVADLPGIPAEFFEKGFFLDLLDPNADSPLLLDTPTRLALRQAGNSDESQENYSLLRSTSLSSNQPQLFEAYAKELDQILNPILETPSSILDIFYPQKECIKPLYQRKAEKTIKLLLKECAIKVLGIQINLKTDFLVPLYHLINNLGVYFNIQATNTLDILDALQARGFFDQASAKLIKEVVGAIYLIRLRLHFRSGKASDEAMMQPSLSSAAVSLLEEERHWLKRAHTLVLTPLYASLKQGVPDWIDLLASMRLKAIEDRCSGQEALCQDWINQFKHYVQYLHDTAERESIETLYQFLSRDSRFERLRYEMFTLFPHLYPELFCLPNEQTGFRYSYLQQFQELQNRLMSLTLSAEKIQRISPDGVKVKIDFAQWEETLIPLIPCSFNAPAKIVTRYLHPSLVKDLLDEDSVNHPSDQSTLWLKRYYPNSLHRVVPLSKEGQTLHFKERPTHAPMEFAVVSLLSRLFGRGVTPSVLTRLIIEHPNGQTYSTAVSISLSQEGDPLSTLLKTEKNLQMDPVQLTEQLIAHVLILPTDAHGGNFLVSRDTPRKLVSLDMEASFVPLRSSETTEIQFVSELFCHSFIPHLSPEVLQRFTNIKTGELLTAWLNELIDLLEGWNPLFSQEKEWLLTPLVDPQDKLRRDQICLVESLIPPGTVGRLYQQITKLKQLFQKPGMISPFQLLEQIITCWDEKSHLIGPAIAKRYQASHKQLLFFERPASERLAIAAGKSIHASQSSSYTLRSLVGHLPTKQDLEHQLYHPNQALKELGIMNCLYETSVQVNRQGKNQSVHVQEHHQLTLETQRMLLRLLIASEGVTHLCLPDFTALDNQFLVQILKKHSHTLKTITLKRCPQITWAPLIAQASQLSFLEEIVVSGDHLGNCCLPNSQAVRFPRLKKFAWEEAGNKQSFLALEVPILQHLRLSDHINFQFATKTLKSFIWINGTLTDKVLADLLGQNPHLKQLNIQGCQFITQLPPHPTLQIINISHTPISKIVGDYPILKQLKANLCSKLTTIDITSPSLVELNLKDRLSLSASEIRSSQLTLVDLSTFEGTNEAIFEEIAKHPSSTIKIVSLIFNNSKELESLIQVCAEENIYFSLIGTIESSFSEFQKLLPKFSPSLFDLGVRFTERISQEEARLLAEALPDTRLTNLDFFGKAQWEKFFGEIGEAPPLPSGMLKLLNSGCPIWAGKRVEETHKLVLVPHRVNGAPLTLTNLGELIKTPREGHKTDYRHYKKEHGDTGSIGSHWVLMTKDVIPGSRGKSYAEQQGLVAGLVGGYAVPSALDAAVCILLEHVETGVRLYSIDPWTCTRCQEQVRGRWQAVVGGFAPAGLHVDYDNYDDVSVGMAAARKF